MSSCSSALIVKQIGMEIVKTLTMGLCTKSISSQEEISPVGKTYLQCGIQMVCKCSTLLLSQFGHSTLLLMNYHTSYTQGIGTLFLVGFGLATLNQACTCSLNKSVKPVAGKHRHSLHAHTINGPMKFVSKVVLLAGACDLPAKAIALNFKPFNSFNGCCKCLQSGNTFGLGPHLSPTSTYSEDNPKRPAKPRESTTSDQKHAMNGGDLRNRVLGSSWFNCLKYYDIIQELLLTTCMECCSG